MPIRYKPIKNVRLSTKKMRYDEIDFGVCLRFFEFNVSGFSTYDDTGAPSPTVNLNPGPLADEVIGAFAKFIDDLKCPSVQLRANFRKKFLVEAARTADRAIEATTSGPERYFILKRPFHTELQEVSSIRSLA